VKEKKSVGSDGERKHSKGGPDDDPKEKGVKKRKKSHAGLNEDRRRKKDKKKDNKEKETEKEKETDNKEKEGKEESNINEKEKEKEAIEKEKEDKEEKGKAEADHESEEEKPLEVTLEECFECIADMQMLLENLKLDMLTDLREIFFFPY